MTAQRPSARKTLGILGSRGYVGQELVPLARQHGGFDVRLVDDVRERCDAYVLALPNGVAKDYLPNIAADAVVVDLSADHRFDDAWVYGQPERLRAQISGATRISNPGCYATAMQLALAPLVPHLDGPAHVFGVSGYSGAGKKPSPKNDPKLLEDNLLPYSLVDHVHEREVSRQLGVPLFFAPHVAPFFRGITVTVSCALRENMDVDAVTALYQRAYESEAGVHLSKDAPLVRDVRDQHDVFIGGVTTGPKRVAVVATIDNLLGGAASQAIRNLNLALGFPERRGLDA